MKKIVSVLTISMLFVFVSCANADSGSGSGSSSSGNPEKPMKDDAKVVFLHHSTGKNIWNGGVLASFNSKKGSATYSLTEKAYPTNGAGNYGWKNYPYDYWNIWIEHGNNAQYKNQKTLKTLVKEYDVIVWKHCFPVSDVVADSGSASVSSEAKQIQNYKLQYNALKEKMKSYSDKRFIVWTGAARVQGRTNKENAQRAKEFSDWVINTWDEKGDNIYVFDFRKLETEGGLYLLGKNAHGATDSHPNATFAKSAAPKFAKRIIDVLKGNGDYKADKSPSSLTGE